MVCLAVRSHDTAAIHRQHSVELLQRHVLHQHVIAPLQKAVVHGEHRHQPLFSHAAGHRHAVPLGDTHVEEPRRELLGKTCQPRAVRHGGGDGAHAPVLPRQLAQRFAEHVGECLAALLIHLACSRVKGRHTVKFLRLPQGVGIAVALHRVDMYQHGTPGLPRLPQHHRQPLHIVTVHRPHVRKAHVLEHGAHRRQQRLFQRRFQLVAPLVQRPSRRQLFQRLPVLFLELIVLRLRPHPGQVLGQPAHILVDGHPVVVEDDHHGLAAASCVVEPLKAQSAAQRPVADDRHHLVVPVQQRPRPRHAQRHRHRVRGVPGHKGVVLALVGLGEPRQSSELPQRAEQLPPPGQRLVYVALVSHVQYQPVAGGVEHPVYGHRQLHRTQVGRQVPAGAGHLLHQKPPQLLAQLRRLFLRQTLHIRRTVDLP